MSRFYVLCLLPTVPTLATNAFINQETWVPMELDPCSASTAQGPVKRCTPSGILLLKDLSGAQKPRQGTFNGEIIFEFLFPVPPIIEAPGSLQNTIDHLDDYPAGYVHLNAQNCWLLEVAMGYHGAIQGNSVVV